MIRSHESAYIDHINRLLEEAVEKDEIESVDTRAVAIMLGTVARIFSKKNHQEKLAASAEESANMISGLIIDGLVKSK